MSKVINMRDPFMALRPINQLLSFIDALIAALENGEVVMTQGIPTPDAIFTYQKVRAKFQCKKIFILKEDPYEAAELAAWEMNRIYDEIEKFMIIRA